MDFTLMIIIKDGTMAGGYALTSQLKTFPTRELAETVYDSIIEQWSRSSGILQVLKLYI